MLMLLFIPKVFTLTIFVMFFCCMALYIYFLIIQHEMSSRMSLEQCVELWEVDSIAVKHNLISLIEVREFNKRLPQQ